MESVIEQLAAIRHGVIWATRAACTFCASGNVPYRIGSQWSHNVPGRCMICNAGGVYENDLLKPGEAARLALPAPATEGAKR